MTNAVILSIFLFVAAAGDRVDRWLERRRREKEVSDG